MSMFGAPSSSAGTGFSFGAASGTSAAPSSGGFSGFSFGTTTSGATPSTTSGGFGGFSFAGAPASSSAASTGFSFGATTKPVNGTSTGFGGFSLGSQQPTSQASSTSGGFSFGQPATTSEAAASTSTGSIATGAASGFAFKTATSAAAPPPAYSAAGGTSGSLLGGLLTAPASTATSTLTTTSSLTPSTAFSFGATGTTPTTTSATTTTSTTGFNFGFGSTPQSSAASTLGGLGGFGATSTSATTVTSTLQTSTSLATTSLPPAQKPMTFRQLEDTINKWTGELEEQEKYFLEQATQVNAWDRVVMENGEKIVQLNQDVEKVKLDQQKLDHELDFVQSQQKELEDILVPLEKALDSLPPISYQQHADIEREHTYNLAESLDAQLKRMGQDLKEIIERLNANNSKPEADDPVHQITKILNAHFMSLMWVDRNTANLQKRVEEISKQMDIERREQEKYFRLAYS
ncbi:nuclear pore glycoprotein p62-like isoform X1 [Biomphalaria glabrata]|uniref:Nuclear pore glycoprotein p62-like isoform X1 n=2 Tax=Biomphalaria glabrata TaxID=6526 RepID=A0A9W3BMQ2_BIOGL|nr:nuclear pore glycoprotein p62-like isoform X1 [Biomphalaria glabrata]